MIRTLAIAGMMSFVVLAGGQAQAGESTGVAACDEFLNKYEACVASKVPAAQQAALKPQLDMTRKTYADMAKNASAKPTMETSCKQAMDQVKVALQAYGCSF